MTKTHDKVTDIANKATQAVATQGPRAPQEILSTDLLIPKLLLMQGQSDLVVDRKFVSGDLIRSTTEEKLGDDKSAPILFVPLKATYDWSEQEKVGQKFEYRRTVPRTASNENAPWSFFKNAAGQEFDKPGQMGATEWRRVKAINIYAILPRDIDAFTTELEKSQKSGEMPDLTKGVLPIVISFRSTSFNAGKTVTTFFAQVQEMLQYTPNVKHYAYTLPLTCYGDKNDLGSLFVLKVGSPAKLDAKYLPQVERWYKTLAQMSDVKIDTRGETETIREAGNY